MKVAVISGVTGQDGALLASLLVNKGYRVIGLTPYDRATDIYRMEYLGVYNQVELRKIDLLNQQQLQNLLTEFRVDEFYNLAAISSVGLSFHQPLYTFDFNTRSVLCILESIRLTSAHTRFYQASSSEMFGNVGAGRLPIVESFLFHPVSPYAISKASAHWLTVNYREAYKLNTCCGILFNHESALRPHNFVIKKIVSTAVSIKKGNRQKLKLGNLSVVRDWGYAPLYVDAMWRMMQQETMDDYLICSGTHVKLETLARTIFSTLNLEFEDHVETDHSLLRSLDLEKIYGDNTKAKKELGWQYNLSSEDLVEKLIQDEMVLSDWEEKRGI